MNKTSNMIIALCHDVSTVDSGKSYLASSWDIKSLILKAGHQGTSTDEIVLVEYMAKILSTTN